MAKYGRWKYIIYSNINLFSYTSLYTISNSYNDFSKKNQYIYS